MSHIVEIKDVWKEYPLGKTTVTALRGVNLTIDTGEFTTIAGPSGSGKTTLLNLLGCVDVATRGTVMIDGQSTGELGDAGLTNLRLNKIGFIFQSFNLVAVLDLYQNVEFPLLLQGGMTSKEREARVRKAIEEVDLLKQIRQRPSELSGGQRQRVAIARALVTRPRIVLADEPTANLDSVTGQIILDLMKHLNEVEKTTFIFSTHDQHVMERARRIIRIHDGVIANSEGVLQEPAAPKPATVAA